MRLKINVAQTPRVDHIGKNLGQGEVAGKLYSLVPKL